MGKSTTVDDDAEVAFDDEDERDDDDAGGLASISPSTDANGDGGECPSRQLLSPPHIWPLSIQIMCHLEPSHWWVWTMFGLRLASRVDWIQK